MVGIPPNHPNTLEIKLSHLGHSRTTNRKGHMTKDASSKEKCECAENHQGKTAILTGREHWGPGTVVGDHGFVALDGRHWLRVLINVNHFYVPCTEVALTAE